MACKQARADDGKDVVSKTAHKTSFADFKRCLSGSIPKDHTFARFFSHVFRLRLTTDMNNISVVAKWDGRKGRFSRC